MKALANFRLIITFVVIIIFALPVVSLAQKFHLNATCIKAFKPDEGVSKIQVGDKVLLEGYRYDPSTGRYLLTGKYKDANLMISNSDLNLLEFTEFSNKNEVWDYIRVKNSYYKTLESRYELRKELEDDSFELIKQLESNYGFFEDEFLEDYIQQLVFSIHDITLSDGRPGNLSIKILNSTTPNAYQTPTGIMIITTGLLSTIRSEDELIGVLSHEIAHFVLDHSVNNIVAQIARQKRAEFWAGFATLAVAATEAYLNSTGNYNTGGMLTYSAAVLSTTIAAQIIDRMGNNYSIAQEEQADDAAVLMMKYFNRDPKAFAAALSRVNEYLVINGLSNGLGGDTHPSTYSRIAKIGLVKTETYNKVDYDKIISMVNTYNAISEMSSNRYLSSFSLSDRNIKAGVATEMDYLVKSMSTRVLYNTEQSNLDALNLIQTAKGLNVVPNLYIYKQEGITLLRLGRNSEAVKSFEAYLTGLNEQDERTEWIEKETDWTKTMIYKCNVL